MKYPPTPHVVSMDMIMVSGMLINFRLYSSFVSLKIMKRRRQIGRTGKNIGPTALMPYSANRFMSSLFKRTRLKPCKVCVQPSRKSHNTYNTEILTIANQNQNPPDCPQSFLVVSMVLVTTSTFPPTRTVAASNLSIACSWFAENWIIPLKVSGGKLDR